MLRAVLVLAWASAASAQPAQADQAAAPPAQPASSERPPSKFRSPDDGWLDISGFLDAPYGFLPVAAPITEPAVGVGALAVATFIKQVQGVARPNITAIGAFGTDNGTKGALAGDIRQWRAGRIQTVAGAFFASVNLDFYGVGHDDGLAKAPLQYTLEPAGGTFEAKFRLGDSPVWIGGSYAYARTGISFVAPEGTPGRPDAPRRSTVAGITPSLTLDTRNNMFGPTRGTYVEAKVSLYGTALGGDDSFQRVRVIGMQFNPITSRLFFGVRGETAAAIGDAPFYVKPYVYQRGVPAMRFLGDQMAQFETELRWQFWKRFSVLGFAGAGGTWTDSLAGEDRSEQVTAGGGGLRYELARTHGLHVGVDVASGPTGRVVYVQFGSAWARP